MSLSEQDDALEDQCLAFEHGFWVGDQWSRDP